VLSSKFSAQAGAEVISMSEALSPQYEKEFLFAPGKTQPVIMKGSKKKDDYASAAQPMSSPWIALNMSGKVAGGPSNLKMLCFAGAALGVLILVVLAVQAESEDDEPSEAKSYADLRAFTFSEGTWAQTYREAQGSQKEALELLYRCNIIPQQEFANSIVSKERIDECLWVATHMLKQKTLEQWLVAWRQAKKEFEESVSAACLTARTLPPSEPSMPPTSMASPGQAEYINGTTPPRTAPARLIGQTPGSPTSTTTGQAYRAPSDGPSPRVVASRDGAGQNLLIMRCREIMQQADRDRPSSVRLASTVGTVGTVGTGTIVSRTAQSAGEPFTSSRSIPEPAPEEDADGKM